MGNISFNPEKVVPLHPLFGVIAGRKYREACYVALERYNKFNYKINKMDLIKVAEEAFATGKKFPEFKAGDTITVAYKIRLSRSQVTETRSASLFVRCQALWVLSVSSPLSLRTLRASRLTR